MIFDIINFHFLFDIIFYYLIILLITDRVRKIRKQSNSDLFPFWQRYLPTVALISIIAILGYAFIFDRNRISPVNLIYQPPIPAPSPTPEPKRLRVKLNEINKSGESGFADLSENDDSVQIVIRIGGGEPDIEQSVYIYSGTCEKVKEMKYPLLNITSKPPMLDGAINIGEIGIYNDFDMDQLIKELPLVIAVHKSTEKKSNIVSCGQITSKGNPGAEIERAALPEIIERLKEVCSILVAT